MTKMAARAKTGDACLVGERDVAEKEADDELYAGMRVGDVGAGVLC